MKQEGSFDYLFKIICLGNQLQYLGDCGSGKTSVLLRFINNNFNIKTISTVDMDVIPKTVKVYDKNVKCQFFDTTGTQSYMPLMATCIQKMNFVGALICYDITNRSSFSRAQEYLKLLRSNTQHNIIVLLIGNKIDKPDDRCVETSEGIRFSQEQGIGFMETSAFDGTNIKLSFMQILAEIVEQEMKVHK